MRFQASERLPDHTFLDADEGLHTPPNPLPARWQENTMLVGWDLDGGHGFLIHTKRWPAKNDYEAHVAIYVDGKPCSVILHRPVGGVRKMWEGLPGMSWEMDTTWSRWRMQVEIKGAEGNGPFGFIAHVPSGSVVASLDIKFESDLQPADFNVALATWAKTLKESGAKQHNSAQEHYEQGGRWSGTLTVGGRKVKTSGLFIRDHTWGDRVESNFDSGVFWTASSLDQGNIFCNAIGFPGPLKTIGTGILVNEKGSFVTQSVRGEFSPAPGLWAYDTSSIHFGFEEPFAMECRTKVHVPKYLPGSGHHRYDNNAISYVNIGDKTGMGCIEWAAVLGRDQAAILDDLLLEKS